MTVIINYLILLLSYVKYIYLFNLRSIKLHAFEAFTPRHSQITLFYFIFIFCPFSNFTFTEINEIKLNVFNENNLYKLSESLEKYGGTNILLLIFLASQRKCKILF